MSVPSYRAARTRRGVEVVEAMFRGLKNEPGFLIDHPAPESLLQLVARVCEDLLKLEDSTVESRVAELESEVTRLRSALAEAARAMRLHNERIRTECPEMVTTLREAAWAAEAALGRLGL